MSKDKKTDELPSHEELDALQAKIDAAAKELAGQSGENAKNPQEAAGETPLGREEALQARIEELEAELATAKDRALRALADADNTKKRAEREVRAASIYAVEKFAADMLSVSDNLARALATLDDEARKSLGENAKNLLDGLELTEKDLMAVFARHGIKPVPGKGAKFDPNVHQAVAQIPSDEAKGDIAEVMQTGFTLGDRTLRAAIVAVSTGKEKKQA